MMLSPTSLERLGPCAYRVRIDHSGSGGRPGGTASFDFTVSTGDDGIAVVESTPEFHSFIGFSGGPVAHLLAAVLEFHRSQNANIPDAQQGRSPSVTRRRS